MSNNFDEYEDGIPQTSATSHPFSSSTWHYESTTTEEVQSNCTHINGTEKHFVFSESDSIAAGVIASFCSVGGAIFNILTILALLNHKPTRRHATTPFVISLATSDLLFSSVTLPILASRFFARDWIVGAENGFFCQLFPLLFYGNTAATLLNIMAVTINRWCLIYFPTESERIFTRTRSKLFIAICWILPVIVVSPSLSGVWGRHGLEEFTQSCTIVKDAKGRSPKILLMTIGVALPSVILVIANTMIFFKILLIRKKMEYEIRNSAVSLPKGLKEREQRLTKMMLIIFTVFIITYMPSYFVKTFFDKHYCHPTAHVACYVINWLAVIMDPSIYVATQERYRFALRLLWLRIKYIRHPERYNNEFRRPSYHLSQIRSTSGEE